MAVLLAAALPCSAQTLQQTVDATLRPYKGTAVVVDVRGNKVLAAHDLRLAAQRVATPGSTVKSFVLLKLLETGAAKPSDRFVCPRQVRIAGKRLDCTHPPLPQAIDPSDALAWSCNAYFAAAAQRLRPKELAEALRASGLVSQTGLAADEAHGEVRQAGDVDQLRLQALGEWGVLTTPLELLEAYRKLAERRAEPNVQLVWQGLEHSVGYGMARAAHMDKVDIAGKTGTAAQPYAADTHAWFVGLAPADKPEIALVIYLEHGRGVDAAALAQPIVAAYFRVQR
jgi:penicillin-binding protein 2